MIKWVLALAVVCAMLSGCSENSGRPNDNSINLTTAPAPSDTVPPTEKPKAFPVVYDPYDPDQAVSNGDVVNVLGKVYNLDMWNLFLANVDNGMPSQVRITQYTDEGDPILYELVYDGAEAITYTYDNSRDGFGSETGRRSTVCRGIEPEQNKEFGPHYKLIGCDDDTDNTFWFSSIAVGAESKYYGEKLEIAELIHLRVRYIEEGDLVKYQSLLHKKSPLYQAYDSEPEKFPAYKVDGIHLTTDIEVTEQKNVFQAVVQAEELRRNDNESSLVNSTFIFTKGKAAPDNKWLFLDID